MNQHRLKEIHSLAERLSEILSEVETLRDQEREYLDAIPENMHEGEKHARSELAVESLESAVSSIDDARGQLELVE